MPPVFGSGLNPGYIQPKPFYNTTNDAQSKYYWGQHGYQYGPTFDAKQYNQVAAPATPWGQQGIATPLTGPEIADIVAGKSYIGGPVRPATRVEQYVPDTRIPPSYGQVMLNPSYKGTAVAPTTTGGTTDSQFKQIAEKLGPNWATDLQTAATNGNWDEYNRIQQLVNSILNPVIDRY